MKTQTARAAPSRSPILLRETLGSIAVLTLNRPDARNSLSEAMLGALQQAIARVRVVHAQDVSAGLDGVWLPHALERKYPNAGRELGWQYLFQAATPSIDAWTATTLVMSLAPPVTNATRSFSFIGRSPSR